MLLSYLSYPQKQGDEVDLPETFLGAFRMDLGTLLGLTFYIRDHFFRVSVRRDISHDAADAQDQYQGGSHNEEKRLQRTL